MNPYRDPYSPESREMREAGRTPFGVYKVPRPYGGALTCQAQIEQKTVPFRGVQHFTRCGEPIAAVAPHPTVPSSVLNLCIRHGTIAYERGTAVRFRCSVCGKPYRWPSSLDSSGRGIECQP